MKVDKILEYQKLDSQLFKIEKQLKDNENKKVASTMHENMKNAQTRSLKLEEKAGTILAEIEKVKKQFKVQEDKMNEFMAKDLSKMSKEEVKKVSILKDKLAQNLAILEKNLSALAENVNAVLADFNNTIKVFNTSKDKYLESKSKFDEDVKSVENEKQKIADELKKLEKNVDSKMMESYLKRRKENIFPVVVPLKGNCCGGCHIELAYANLSTLDNDGVLSCEHCHRLIYREE